MVMDIMNYGPREKYDQLKRFGDRPADMKGIDRERIKPILNDLYMNNTERGGRPDFDPVFMVRILFLQSLYGLVDEAMEMELYSILLWISSFPLLGQEGGSSHELSASSFAVHLSFCQGLCLPLPSRLPYSQDRNSSDPDTSVHST
jgi:hypothetical protein